MGKPSHTTLTGSGRLNHPEDCCTKPTRRCHSCVRRFSQSCSRPYVPLCAGGSSPSCPRLRHRRALRYLRRRCPSRPRRGPDRQDSPWLSPTRVDYPLTLPMPKHAAESVGRLGSVRRWRVSVYVLWMFREPDAAEQTLNNFLHLVRNPGHVGEFSPLLGGVEFGL